MRKRLKPFVFWTMLCSLVSTLFIILLMNPTPPEKLTSTEQQTVTKQTVDKVTTTMSNMTIEEKVGQLFWARVPYENAISDIENYHLGGYILFGKDFQGQTLASIKNTIDNFQKVSPIPMLIASDEEGGEVTRISQLLEQSFQSPLNLYQTGGISAIQSDTITKAKILKSVGIQAGLFPVADMAHDSSSFIYNRTIGASIDETSKYITTVVKTLNNEHLVSTLKHFPGYGDNGDSHTDIIYDNRSLSEFEKTDFIPFKAGIKAGADSILVAHNIVQSIDNVPASISPNINQILRKDLNFKGVIMTDDLDMAGLARYTTQEEAAYLAIKAGNDMVLSSAYATQIPYILEKIKNGELDEDQINQSVERILRLKEKIKLLS